MLEELLNSLAARKGHYRFESGHHGELWLDLELLCLHPKRISQFAAELAERLSRHKIEAVCGPLVEGAFVAMLVASELDVEFCYAERFAPPRTDSLFSVKYRVPHRLLDKMRGKRVAIVNDVINAGSAVRGTMTDLKSCDARPVAIGALLVLGSSASQFAAEENVALETPYSLPNRLWSPSECPLCAAGVPLEDTADKWDEWVGPRRIRASD